MDMEDSMYATTADLLSLRYTPLTGGNSPCGGGGSLLLSSPWPISSTPSPPSSVSSSSLSASSPSSSSSTSSLQTINEGTLLSLSGGSPGGHQDMQVTSPLTPGQSQCGQIIVGSSSGSGGLLDHHSAGATVIFTTAGGTGAPATALTLVDPVSSPALEVAHAPGKSILCVHEQEHGDLIHFSTSTTTTATAASQLNHVNGNGNENRTGATTTTLLEAASVGKAVAGDDGFGDVGISSSTATDTDGNLFPTLILTSTGNSNDHVIPMRLYASLTSPSNDHHHHVITTSSTTINGSTILTTSGGGIGGDMDGNGNATCILMTTRQSGDDDDDNNNDLHQVLLSQHHHHHQDQGHHLSSGGGTFTLAGFAEQLGVGTDCDQNSTNLGTTTILMDDCFSSSLNGKGPFSSDGGSPSHGKLKDILMNGSNSQHHQSHHLQLNRALVNHHHHDSTNDINGEGSYTLRDLEPQTTVVYDNRVNGGNIQNGTVSSGTTTFLIPKEEDDGLEELKLHSDGADEQSSFNDAINSIYQDGGAAHIMVTGSVPCSSSAGTMYGTHSGSIFAIAPSSTSTTTNSVIWSNSGGIVETVDLRGGDGSSSGGGILHFDDGSSPFLLKEDIGDLDGIEDDDLLEAKEEMDDDLYGDGDDGELDDGTGAKGELKCKFCGFVCCSKSSLGIHERRHTGERPFACKYCGRLFNSAQCCKHHERLHTGDKPFQCSYCGKKYAVSTRLKRHERVHTREEPYKCTECNKTFRWFDAFRDHRNTHTGVPLYLCSVCGKTFTSYLKFYYHERGHLMKKERDRDRLIKQRMANGLAASTNPWPVKRVYLSPRNRSVPISHTIDILKSLQKNSSASIISSLSQQAQQLVNLNGVGGGGGGNTKKNGGAGGGGAKGQSKKSQGKAASKKQQQVSNGNHQNAISTS